MWLCYICSCDWSYDMHSAPFLYLYLVPPLLQVSFAWHHPLYTEPIQDQPPANALPSSNVAEDDLHEDQTSTHEAPTNIQSSSSSDSLLSISLPWLPANQRNTPSWVPWGSRLINAGKWTALSLEHSGSMINGEQVNPLHSLCWQKIRKTWTWV